MALKRKRRLTAEWITVSVICCLVLVPFLFSLLILPTNYWDNLSAPADVIFTVGMIAALCAVTAAICGGSAVTARRAYIMIARAALEADGKAYSSACDDVSGGKRFGELYCGREWLFSPLGLLYRWQYIKGISVKLCYGRGWRDQNPFRLGEITVLLSDGSRETVTVSDRKELIHLNETFAEFAAFAGEMGVRAEIKFE